MKTLDKIYVCTNVLAIPGSEQAIYWFGRADQKDEMRPLKIVATDYKRAWLALQVHYTCAVEDVLNELNAKLDQK